MLREAVKRLMAPCANSLQEIHYHCNRHHHHHHHHHHYHHQQLCVVGKGHHVAVFIAFRENSVEMQPT